MKLFTAMLALVLFLILPMSASAVECIDSCCCPERAPCFGWCIAVCGSYTKEDAESAMSGYNKRIKEHEQEEKAKKEKGFKR
jgi:hypothetical protein